MKISIPKAFSKTLSLKEIHYVLKWKKFKKSETLTEKRNYATEPSKEHPKGIKIPPQLIVQRFFNNLRQLGKSLKTIRSVSSFVADYFLFLTFLFILTSLKNSLSFKLYFFQYLKKYLLFYLIMIF